MQSAGVNACTDITGFGLMGHAMEMAKGSDAGIRIYGKTVPVFEEALNLVKEGFVPGGTRSNQAFLENDVIIDGSFSDEWITLLYDAQTSGGLLISVSSDKSDILVEELRKCNVETIAVIGEIIAQHPGKITIL